VSLGAAAILTALRDHALTTGRFERVLGHEPKGTPGNGLTAAIWAQRMEPTTSGLDSTSARLVFSIRIQGNMLAEPQDDIDIRVLEAVDALMAAYTGDFTLGGLVRSVDALGADGEPLSADAGYLEQDGKLYRAMVITLPLHINDLWTQAP
jgi:hypothetical protein